MTWQPSLVDTTWRLLLKTLVLAGVSIPAVVIRATYKSFGFSPWGLPALLLLLSVFIYKNTPSEAYINGNHWHCFKYQLVKCLGMQWHQLHTIQYKDVMNLADMTTFH